MGDRDGCSCPYTVKLFQKINNPILAPCTDMEVVLTISNLTNEVLIDHTLFEAFPDNYIISEIVYNPFIGDITSGVGEDQFEMSGMEIPYGVDSIKLIVSVPENAGGEEHTMQAELMVTKVNTDETSSYLSNDLFNTVKNSPTTIQINEIADIFESIIPDVVELCDGDTFRLVLPASNDFTYEWSDGTDTLVRSFAVNEELSIDVISACRKESFDISIQETQFTVSLGQDIYFNRGDLVTLVAEVSSLSPVDSFIWKTIDDEIPCDQCQSIQVLAKEDIKYLLVATNESGCVTTDEINLFVDRKLYMPNAFSPNGDGVNDYFYFVSGFPSIEIKKMNVYDRWGGIVFSAENLTSNIETSGWDGIANGKLAPTGTYFWTATIAVNESRVELLIGTLMLQK